MRRLPGFTPTRSSFANPLRLSELVRPFGIGSVMPPPAPRDRLAAGDSRTDPKRHRKMLEPYRDERVLQAPNRSQSGPTSVRPGWPLLPRLSTVKKCD